MAEIKNYTLNFGPQHPAAHGVLRLVLELDGEVIQRADPHIGLLHRATEKLAETKTYIQSAALHGPARLRVDDVQRARLLPGHREAAGRRRADARAVHPRDVQRDHAHAEPPDVAGRARLDCGAMNIFIYCFREREDLFDMYEAVSGARMHAAYFRPGGVYRDLPDRMPQYQVSRIKNEKAIKALNANRQGTLLDFIDDFTRASRRTSTSTRRC
jgi:NADH-quinone oxidoreductase subunit D